MDKVLLTIVICIFAAIFSCCVDEEGDTGLTVVGSTTVQPIVTKAAEAYMKNNPGVEIGVQGGGSGTGIRMVGEGSVAIGASSRELKESEQEENPDMLLHAIAIDCITIVVHPSNTIDDLSIEEVRDIFSGEIKNFREVGGPDREIVVVMREDGSGTRSTFEELVMGDWKITNAALQKPASGAIRFSVGGNENSIGYLGIGYLDETVKAIAVGGVPPTEENIRKGKYSISRKLYLITKGEPRGEAKEFIDYILSEDGQKMVEEEGFIKVKDSA
ncbi:MAG: phosphate ABC transporter substrate-binding protein [Candidatus Altiarchaeota archaeon]|nr:phosphate ABC transporter substrate-binding protein [Candidatus Altiarchaeota archaeon]